MDVKPLKRVLFTTGSMNGGGAERVISVLANAFAARGIDVCICCIGRQKADLSYVLDKRVKLVNINAESGGKFGQLRRLRQTVKAFAPDVVVAFMSFIAVQTLAACLCTGIPVVYSIRNFVLPDSHAEMGKVDPAWRITHWATLLLFPWARGAVYQSKEQQNCFKSSRRRKERIILNPVDHTPLWDTPHTQIDKKIIAVGRLSKEKNYPLLIQAFAHIAPRYPDYRLVILGEGAERPTLESFISQLGMEEKISLPGFALDVPQQVFTATAYILSSDCEGMPNALLEAMCLGLPCISTDFRGGVASTLIEDGVNGLLVPPGDEAALAEAMENLLSDPSRRKTIGEKARELQKRVNTS